MEAYLFLWLTALAEIYVQSKELVNLPSYIFSWVFVLGLTLWMFFIPIQYHVTEKKESLGEGRVKEMYNGVKVNKWY